MEMILNENDIVVGASFEDGTIQDYVDEANTYGLVRSQETSANWFLYNDEDSPLEIKDLYRKVKQDKNHFIQNDFGEEVVIFNKDGSASYEELALIVDKYLNAEINPAF